MLNSINKKIPFFSYLILCFFTGCQKESVSPAEFEKYINAFLNESQKRGRSIDIKKPELVIEFFEPPGISQCSFSNGKRIVSINSEVWRKSDELEREYLIFHELGHCLLDLNHDNCPLPDGSSKSMMCGLNGLCSESNHCFLIYGGMKRDYYLDQLFDEKTPIPEWSKIDTFQDKYLTANKQLLVSEEFNDSTNILSSGPFHSMFTNGQMEVSGRSYLKFKNFSDFTNQPNIEIETSFKILGAEDNYIDISWIPLFGPNLYNSFGLTVSKTKGNFFLSISFRTLGGYYNNINKFMKPDGYNVMKIQRVGDVAYFYLNDRLFFIQDFLPISKTGTFTIDRQPIFGMFSIITNGQCSFDFIRVKKIM